MLFGLLDYLKVCTLECNLKFSKTLYLCIFLYKDVAYNICVDKMCKGTKVKRKIRTGICIPQEVIDQARKVNEIQGIPISRQFELAWKDKYAEELQ